MVRFSKEREICIKRSLEQAFKERGKPVQSSLVKKFYKQFINLLNIVYFYNIMHIVMIVANRNATIIINKAPNRISNLVIATLPTTLTLPNPMPAHKSCAIL